MSRSVDYSFPNQMGKAQKVYASIPETVYEVTLTHEAVCSHTINLRDFSQS